MKALYNFEAEFRKDIGGSAAKKLKEKSSIPAVIYGKGQKTQHIKLDHNHFLNTIEDQKSLTSIVNVRIDGVDHLAVLKDIQRHLCVNKILHVDFQLLDNKTHIVKKIPLILVDAEKSPGVKLGALLTLLQSTVEVRCLPKDLPQEVIIDCSEMQASTSLKLSELKLPNSVQLLSLTKGGRAHDHAVVMVGKGK